MTELGQKLKEAREAKGLSIDQLHEVTRIQKRYLVTIEEGDYSILPGAFYTRAFIKQYADAVGLNGEELLTEYQSVIPQSESRDVPQVSKGQKTQETMQKAASLPIADHMPKILVALLVIALGVAVWFVFQWLTGKDDGQVQQNKSERIEVQKAKDSPLDEKKEGAKAEESKKEEPKKEEPKKEEPKKEEPPTGQEEVKLVGTSGKVSTYEIHNNKELQLEITARGTSYVDVKNEGGNEIYNATLEAGQTAQQNLTAEKEIRLNIGNTPNIEIKVNGKVVDYGISAEEAMHQRLVIKNLGAGQPVQ
ncbi:helix-turn-helix domain-containing protein [Bacillus gaemokensis]|uniref:Transcriptional regulator n=1 Tax=Bacillus gaemokensis TaxID=574375 RepID=A0A073KGG2_9BACI|nr:helix-turn-helix domain-containing protein [Bacillus gaemokensis]KEK25680.1 transcriptional regulator [Bacillus gaemokensis]KYG38497.1 transcriptional regulator [Bacillus gaemokensis]